MSQTKEEIVELAKKEVCYERQIAVFGQEKADNVLNFWVMGYIKSDEYWQSTITDNKGEETKQRLYTEDEMKKRCIDYSIYWDKHKFEYNYSDREIIYNDFINQLNK